MLRSSNSHPVLSRLQQFQKGPLFRSRQLGFADKIKQWFTLEHRPPCSILAPPSSYFVRHSWRQGSRLGQRNFHQFIYRNHQKVSSMFWRRNSTLRSPTELEIQNFPLLKGHYLELTTSQRHLLDQVLQKDLSQLWHRTKGSTSMTPTL